MLPSKPYCAMTFSSLFLASLFASPALALAEFPRLVPQRRDATYNGGWALGLPSEGCPSDAPVNCQDSAKVINPTCCPFGQTCFGFDQPYCCPTDNDCGNVVNNLPVCANGTWEMWQLSFTGYVCCEPGQIGMNPTSGFAGICENAGQPVISSLIATLASQIGGPPITTGLDGGAAAATGTTTTSPNDVHTTGGTTKNTPTATSASSSSDSNSVFSKVHLTLGEEIGIAVGAVAIIAAVLAAIWCWRRRSRNRTQVTYVEPYRNVGLPSYGGNAAVAGARYGGNGSYGPSLGAGYNAGYAGSDVPLARVGGQAGYGQEYKPPITPREVELGYDERAPAEAELGGR